MSTVQATTVDFTVAVADLAEAYRKADACLEALGCPSGWRWHITVRLFPQSWQLSSDQPTTWSADVDAVLVRAAPAGVPEPPPPPRL